MCVTIVKMRILAEAQLRLTFLIKKTAQQEELAFFFALLIYPELDVGRAFELAVSAPDI